MKTIYSKRGVAVYQYLDGGDYEIWFDHKVFKLSVRMYWVLVAVGIGIIGISLI